MCMFSGSVRTVSNTRIFARPLEQDRQLLVYGMNLAIDEDVAMVLPIAVPPRSPDDAVKFVDMSSAPTFFDSLAALFPSVVAFGAPQPAAAPASRGLQTLVVHDVGDFEASFVPAQPDFDRLDRRFRLSPEVWAALPRYADWGFCVFKLRSGSTAEAGGVIGAVKRMFGRGKPTPATAKVRHPMAFEFPRRDRSQLFFPTVHVHDGLVHSTAHFDHTLYGQEVGAPWEASPKSVAEAWVPDPLKPFLRHDATVQRMRMLGEGPNEDVVVAVA